jgi:hypothetical protein
MTMYRQLDDIILISYCDTQFRYRAAIVYTYTAAAARTG